jgi:hypothetical protein
MQSSSCFKIIFIIPERRFAHFLLNNSVKFSISLDVNFEFSKTSKLEATIDSHLSFKTLKAKSF